MRQFQQKNVPETLWPRHLGTGDHRQLHFARSAAQFKMHIVQDQVPVCRETIQRRCQAARLALHGHEMLQRARADGTAPKPHHLVPRLGRGKLVKTRDLVHRHTLVRGHRTRLQPRPLQQRLHFFRRAAQFQRVQPILDEPRRYGGQRDGVLTGHVILGLARSDTILARNELIGKPYGR